jgi:hypothetical protein
LQNQYNKQRNKGGIMEKKQEVEIKFFGNKEKILTVFKEKLKLEATIAKVFDDYKFTIKVTLPNPKTAPEIKKWLKKSPWEKFLYAVTTSD